MCTKQDQEKEQGIELPVFRTHLVITISAVVSGFFGAMSRMEVFLHQASIVCQWSG